VGNGYEHRKQWIENRLELLATEFAVSVAGFAIMGNHLHVLVRLDPDDARQWSDEEVLRRWISVYPPRGIDFDDEDNVRMWIEHYAQNSRNIEVYRERLANLGWFMKALKEPLARMANKEDDCKGTFWEGRFKSIAILDEEALLATCAYIDLNPVAAGISATPETSKHTSVRQRVKHFRDKGQIDSLKSARKGSVAASRVIGNAEQDHWLIPIEDRRPHTNARPSSDREGMLATFTLGNYLTLVEYTGRMFRQGKARINDGVKNLFDRLGTSIEFWTDSLQKMLKAKELRGQQFAISDEALQTATQTRSRKRAVNLTPQPG